MLSIIRDLLVIIGGSGKENELKQLHPLCAFKNIDDGFKESPLQFTPNNCAVLWEKIEDVFEEIDERK